jgi:hypothetical protein
MSQVDKYNQAISLLKEINCPSEIMDALWVFGMTVRGDEVKLRNWQALAGPGVVEGECIEVNQQGIPAPKEINQFFRDGE